MLRPTSIEPLKQTVAAEGIGALAFIPLMAQGKLIGKFMVYYDKPHAFAATEIDLAVTIARQLGFSIERVRAEQKRDLLVAELNHRVKNTLATVVAISHQSFAKGRSPEEAHRSFERRVRALAQTTAGSRRQAGPVSRWKWCLATKQRPIATNAATFGSLGLESSSIRRARSVSAWPFTN